MVVRDGVGIWGFVGDLIRVRFRLGFRVRVRVCTIS